MLLSFLGPQEIVLILAFVLFIPVVVLIVILFVYLNRKNRPKHVAKEVGKES